MLYIFYLVNDNCQYFMRPWFFIQVLHLESILSVICDPERVMNQGKLHICSVHFVVTCNWWKHIFQLPVFEKFPCLCPRQKNTNTFWEYVCPKTNKVPLVHSRLSTFFWLVFFWIWHCEYSKTTNIFWVLILKSSRSCVRFESKNVGGTAAAWNAYNILPIKSPHIVIPDVRTKQTPWGLQCFEKPACKKLKQNNWNTKGFLEVGTQKFAPNENCAQTFRAWTLPDFCPIPSFGIQWDCCLHICWTPLGTRWVLCWREPWYEDVSLTWFSLDHKFCEPRRIQSTEERPAAHKRKVSSIHPGTFCFTWAQKNFDPVVIVGSRLDDTLLFLGLTSKISQKGFNAKIWSPCQKMWKPLKDLVRMNPSCVVQIPLMCCLI